MPGGIRFTALAPGDKWHLDEVVVTIYGKKHWLWGGRWTSMVRCATYWRRAAVTGIRPSGTVKLLQTGR